MKSKLFLSLLLLTSIAKGYFYKGLVFTPAKQKAVELCNQISMFRIKRDHFGRPELQMLNNPGGSRYSNINRNIAEEHLPKNLIDIFFNELENDSKLVEFTGADFLDKSNKYNKTQDQSRLVILCKTEGTDKTQWLKLGSYNIEGENELLGKIVSHDEVSKMISAHNMNRFLDKINEGNLKYVFYQNLDKPHSSKAVIGNNQSPTDAPTLSHLTPIGSINPKSASIPSSVATASTQQILDAVVDQMIRSQAMDEAKFVNTVGPKSVIPYGAIVALPGAETSKPTHNALEKAMHRNNNQLLLNASAFPSQEEMSRSMAQSYTAPINTISAREEAKSDSYYDRFKAAYAAGVVSVGSALSAYANSEETSTKEVSDLELFSKQDDKPCRYDALMNANANGYDDAPSAIVDQVTKSVMNSVIPPQAPSITPSWFDSAKTFSSNHQLSVGTGAVVATAGLCYLAYVKRAAISAKAKKAGSSVVSLFRRK